MLQVTGVSLRVGKASLTDIYGFIPSRIFIFLTKVHLRPSCEKKVFQVAAVCHALITTEPETKGQNNPSLLLLPLLLLEQKEQFLSI